MTVSRGADLVLGKCKAEWIQYAGSPERGNYRGFAALHDKCDANMLLPYADSPTVSVTNDDYNAFVSLVMSEVSRRILDSYGCQ